jgi:hypothetical protein
LYKRVGESHGRRGREGEISTSPGLRSPDRPARSCSLYRLRYPGAQIECAKAVTYAVTYAVAKYVQSFRYK